MLVDMAQEALDSAMSAHKRIDGLENEVKNIRNLTAAMARIDTKVDGLESDVKEIKSDVKAMTARPGQWLDKIIAAAIGAISTGIVAAILNVILK
jgi:outer membrane murein-binding lipoprotein Lpp